MSGDNGNVRINGRRGGRRKRQLRERLILFDMVLVGIILILCIRDVKGELKEIRTLLKRIEAMQQGMVETSADVEVKEEADHISGIGITNMERPQARTWDETVQRLEELGRTDQVIAQISKNSSLYPKEMLEALANNPELAGFVAGYLEEDKGIAGGLTDQEKGQDYPLLLQWDSRWGYRSYGRKNLIGLAGCGPTCLSMVLYYLTGDETLTPDRIASYAMENGYYVEGTGTSWALMKDFPGLYGIKAAELKASESIMKGELDKGGLLICAMGEGDFTAAGHFIVIYGYDSGGFRVNDPNSVIRSGKRWAFHEIRDQIKNIWAYENQENVHGNVYMTGGYFGG